ncbi:MAG: VWA domain-containing protein, partial [Pirellulaceae bacterium]|nr:VWA domain-containing protein [Pirellulaceae bacterium]
RLTRRSRLDNLLLLLLRGLAVTLLAIAFSRPFFRAAAQLDLSGIRPRRVAIVMDVSASMRRPGMWDAAIKEAHTTIKDLGPVDQVAIIAFDDKVKIELGFPSSSSALLDKGASVEAAKRVLESLEPGWGASDLGAALTTAADTLDSVQDDERSAARLQIVVISDFQEGANLNALQSYSWPASVHVAPRHIAAGDPGNGALTTVDNPEDDEPRVVRVRVSNASDSQRESFQLQWRIGDQPVGDPVEVYAPAGQTRVARMEQPAEEGVDRIVLIGDDADFDNQFFVTPTKRLAATIAIHSDESADDPKGMRFYLERALSDTPRRTIQWRAAGADNDLDLLDVDLAVIVAPLDADQLEHLREFLRDGGDALLVLREPVQESTLVKLFDQEGLTIEEADVTDYAMFGEINFKHSLFSAFANPKFSDFTGIRFWRHRRLMLASEQAVDVVARFDSGDPAVVEGVVDKGRLVVLCSGWHPDDSQLALSSKFVPLMARLLDRRGDRSAIDGQISIGEQIATPQIARDDTTAWAVRQPGGERLDLAASETFFEQTDSPGVYQFIGSELSLPFAVNIAGSESRTEPLDSERLEQLGAKLGESPTYQEQVDRKRQLRDLELERRQSYWRWFLVIAVVLLILETWLGGRLAGEQSNALQGATS